MAQFLRPDGDITISGSWVDESGGTTNLYLAVDETTASDTDYAQSPSNPGAGTYILFSLSTASDPKSSTGHIFRYRMGKSATSGRTINVDVHLYQGATEIGVWTHTNIDALTTYEQTLSGTQADSITDYEDLRFEFDPTVSGGGAARAARITWAELEIPDPPPAVVTRAHAQAQAYIEIQQNSFAQINARIKQLSRVFAQAQGIIKITVPRFAQAQATIGRPDNLYSYIDEPAANNADFIISVAGGSSSYEGKLEPFTAVEFAQDFIIRFRAFVYGTSDLTVGLYEGAVLKASTIVSLTSSPTDYSYALTNAEIASISNFTDLRLRFAPSATGSLHRVVVTWAALQLPPVTYSAIERQFAQTQARVKQIYTSFVQAQSRIKNSYYSLAQAQAGIRTSYSVFAQSQVRIKNNYFVYAQGQARIKASYRVFAQGQARIKNSYQGYGQAQARVKTTSFVFSQAQSRITQTYTRHAQALGYIFGSQQLHAQAQARLKQVYNVYAQAQAYVNLRIFVHAQAQARIHTSYTVVAQAQGYIGSAIGLQYGQAQAKINAFGVNRFAQAHASITHNLWYGVVTGDSPRHWWKLNDSGSSAENVYYQTPGTYSGTITKEVYSPLPADDINKAITIAGVSAGITLNVPTKFTQTFTLEAWVKPNRTITLATESNSGTGAGTSNTQSYVFLPTNESTNRGIGLSVGTNGIQIIAHGTGMIAPLARYDVSISGWVHVVAVINNKQASIYLNGSLVRTGLTSSATTVYSPIYAGDPVYGYGYFNGSKNNLLIYNKVLTGTEITEHYNAGLPRAYAQAQSRVIQTYRAFAQANARIDSVQHEVHAQAQATLISVGKVFSQVLARILQVYRVYSQAQARIKTNNFRHAQAQSRIKNSYRGYGQAASWIYGYRGNPTANSQALIRQPLHKFAQVQARIVNPSPLQFAQAQASIKQYIFNRHSQSQAFIAGQFRRHAQARARIKRLANVRAAQSASRIRITQRSYAQALAYIKPIVAFGQAQAQILVTSIRCAQALALIGHLKHGLAQGYISSARYLVKFGGRVLPGYAQTEAIISDINITDHFAPFEDGSLAEYTGLKNKMISLQMRVWEEDYLTVKTQVQRAGTIMRAPKGFAKLYIQQPDRYYLALSDKISMEHSASDSSKLADYDVSWHVKPWLYSDAVYTLSGTGTLSTPSRTIEAGGRTPAKVILTGTNITVSGYTESGEFTGFFSVSGYVENLVIDSDLYTATINGENKNNLMNNLNYAIYIGIGTTHITVSGASSCVVEYQNRWYL